MITRKVRRITTVKVKVVRGKNERIVQIYTCYGIEVKPNEDVIAEVETQVFEEPLF